MLENLQMMGENKRKVVTAGENVGGKTCFVRYHTVLPPLLRVGIARKTDGVWFRKRTNNL